MMFSYLQDQDRHYIDLMFKIAIECVLLTAIDTNGVIDDSLGALLELELKENIPGIEDRLSINIGDLHTEGYLLYNTILDIITQRSRKNRPLVHNWITNTSVVITDGGLLMSNGGVVILDIPDVLNIYLDKYDIDTNSELFLNYMDNVIHSTKQLSNNYMRDINDIVEEVTLEFKEMLLDREAITDFITVFKDVINYFMSEFIIIGMLNDIIYLDNVVNDRILFKRYINFNK